MSKSGEVVYAFIDSQNLHKGALDAGWKVDYFRLRNYLKTKYNVVEAFIFIGYIERYKAIYERHRRAGFRLIFKEVTEIHKDGKTEVKGNVDAELVLHTMIEYDNYEKAIIISSDGDFKCLVEFLKSRGKLLRIMTPNSDYSHLLSKYASHIVNLTGIKDKLNKV